MAFFAVAVLAYLVHYIRKWQGAIRRPDLDADDPFVTKKDAQGQSGLALSMVRSHLVLLSDFFAWCMPRRRDTKG